MCKRLSFEEILIKNENDLYRCGGMSLTDMFNLLKREIESYKKDGSKFEIHYTYHTHNFTFTSDRVLKDDADSTDVFSTSKSINPEAFVDLILEDMRGLFLSTYRGAIVPTEFKFRFSNEIHRESEFKWNFDVPISYAWYNIMLGNSNPMFNDCTIVVREYWEYAITKNYVKKYCNSRRYTGE